MADIQNFTATLKSYGAARSNKFEMRFNKLPNLMVGNYNFNLELLTFYCTSVDFPSLGISTAGTSYGVGPEIKTPYGMTGAGGGELKATIMLDANLEILTMFDIWRHKIYDQDKYEVGYFKDLTTEIDVFHINSEDESRGRGYKFREVLLNTYTPPNYSHDNSNKIQMMDVSFEYRVIEFMPPTKISGRQFSSPLSTFESKNSSWAGTPTGTRSGTQIVSNYSIQPRSTTFEDLASAETSKIFRGI